MGFLSFGERKRIKKVSHVQLHAANASKDQTRVPGKTISLI